MLGQYATPESALYELADLSRRIAFEDVPSAGAFMVFDETRKMLDVYTDICAKLLAMPVVKGIKSESEKFAGALRTYSCEAMMQDNKALQAGTSHNLGQNFAKAFELKFQSESGSMEYAWNTSWGVSTRMIGGLVMTHGDDNGLRIPPRLAPIEVVIVPIWKSDEERARLLEAAYQVKQDLTTWGGRGDDRIRVHVDARIDGAAHLVDMRAAASADRQMRLEASALERRQRIFKVLSHKLDQLLTRIPAQRLRCRHSDCAPSKYCSSARLTLERARWSSTR